MSGQMLTLCKQKNSSFGRANQLSVLSYSCWIICQLNSDLKELYLKTLHKHLCHTSPSKIMDKSINSKPSLWTIGKIHQCDYNCALDINQVNYVDMGILVLWIPFLQK